MKLTIRNLSKRYPNGIEALKNVSLEISSGMFGLLGPNGAGKSTLMRILATLQEADDGVADFNGINILRSKHEIRKLLGYLPQDFGFYRNEKAVSLLDHFAALKGMASRRERRDIVENLLVKVNLWDSRNQKLGTFSGGMTQRFGIAQALIGDPKLIIVDEPTAGLDPEERNRFHNLLSEIGENVIVILSTHIVDDVSDLCSQMAIVESGQILMTGSPAVEIEKLKGHIWKKEIPKGDLSRYREKMKVISTQLFAGKTSIVVFSSVPPDSSFEPEEPSLEDVYFKTLLKLESGQPQA